MPDYVRELLSPERLKVVQLFNPAGVAQLTRKATAGVQLGETDNMALAGILSTQLVHFHFVSNFTSERPISENENDIKICGASSAILRENVSTGRSFERNPRRAI
jgi:asparagine synthase (glutamine-hydrolysing)